MSGTPGVADIVALELTDTGDSISIVCGNAIGFNDWRGTTIQMAFTPAALEDCNDVSGNLGDT